MAEARSRAVDLQPVLRGDLLELRPLRAEDFDSLFAVAADPLVWEQHPVKDRHEEDAFRSFFREQLESGGTLVAVDRADGSIVGSSRFHAYDEATSELEIGWTFLARSHWGGVYNREMKRLMLRHAFRFVDNVVFLVDPQNVRSQRAVEKIGAVRFGSRHWPSSTGSTARPQTCRFFRNASSRRGTGWCCWDLWADGRLAGRIAEWGLDEATEAAMWAGHEAFVAQALESLARLRRAT